MSTRRVTNGTIVVATACLLAASCGSSKSSSGATTTVGGATTTAAGGATTTAAGGATTTAAGGATTTAAGGGFLAIPTGSGKYGVDPTNDKVYTGAGGFSVDTSKCPSDWDINQGISDKNIDLFISLPKSGPLAGFGLIADGMNSYFKYVNANGGIGGRNITLTSADDTYDPAKTKTNVDEALQANKYANMVAIIGTPQNLGVWDDLNQECMPQLLTASGAPQWGDVENHPWTTGAQLDYFTEAGLWAQWLKTKFPNGVKVAAITFNSDFGKSYSKGFKSAIKGTNITLVDEEFHDPTAPNIDNQYTTVAASGADVLLLQTTGTFCTQGMADVEKGTWKPTVIMSLTCGSLGQFFKPLIDQGLTGKDTYLIQYIKDVNDPAYADDPIVKLFKETAAAQGLDPKQSTYFTGWIYAWYMTEILKEADSYKGGLNRANIMIAARSITETSPMSIDGVTSKMDGLKDAYLAEGGQMDQYKVTDPKALGSFVKVGDLIDLEGKLGTYATVAAAG